MVSLLSRRHELVPAPGALAVAAGEAGQQLAEERALLEVLSQARMRRGNPVEWQHLLHGVGVAEEHHDFLQIWAAHDQRPPAERLTRDAHQRASTPSKGKTRANHTRQGGLRETSCFLSLTETN